MYQGYCDIITVSTDDDDEESEVAGGEKENQPENRKSKISQKLIMRLDLTRDIAIEI